MRECMPVNIPSKSTCVISLFLTDSRGAMTCDQKISKKSWELIYVIAPVIAPLAYHINFRTHWCITQERAVQAGP